MSDKKVLTVNRYKLLNVVVVDAHASMNSIIRDKLSALGFKRVFKALNGKDALKIIETHAVDLIISDWHMPIMNGLELLKATRKNSKTANTPFIMLSKNINETDVKQAISLGVSEYLLKPFNEKLLEIKISRAFSAPIPRAAIIYASIKTEAEILTPTDIKSSLNNILIVDDESDNIAILSELLKGKYNLKACTSGTKALEICNNENRPDLILLDIMMPEINGLMVCKALKSNPLTEHIPIIFISALDALGDRVKGFDLGGVDYITKPIESKETLARVHTHMQLHHLQINSEALVAERTSDLQKTNEQLQHSYHRLEWAEKIGHLGNWEWNVATNEMFLSDEAFLILGVEPKSRKLDHDEYMQHIHPEDRDNVDRAVSRALSGDSQDYISEHRIVQNNDTRCVYEQGRVNRDEAGNPISLVATVLDITERKLAQEKEHQDALMMHKMMLQTIQAIGTTVEKRDPYTAGHQQRVADLAVAIAQEMNLDSLTVEGIRLGALIHDIGKIYLPAEILSRPGILTDLEFEMIKTHSNVGFDIIKNINFPWPVANMILQHHERLDGSGYPQGLKADDIILEAKIISVADVVEAMASHRPYRASPGLDVALKEIQQGSGIRYDAEVVRCCVLLFSERSYSLPTVDNW